MTQSRHSGELTKSFQSVCIDTMPALNRLRRLLHSMPHATCNWVPGSCVACMMLGGQFFPCQWTLCSQSHCSSAAESSFSRPSMKTWKQRLSSCNLTARRSAVHCSLQAAPSPIGHAWSQSPQFLCMKSDQYCCSISADRESVGHQVSCMHPSYQEFNWRGAQQCITARKPPSPGVHAWCPIPEFAANNVPPMMLCTWRLHVSA